MYITTVDKRCERREERRRKREKGSVMEVIAPPHRIVTTFRSGHQPDRMYSDYVQQTLAPLA